MIENIVDEETKQAMKVTELYLIEAIRAIDSRLGDGYAKHYPDLVSSYIQSCAVVRHSMRSEDIGYKAEVVRLAPKR